MEIDEKERSFEELKIMVKKSLALAEENNRMIRSLRNASRFQAIVRILYFVIFIGGFVFAYYFLQPYVDQLQDTYSSLSSYQDFLK